MAAKRCFPRRHMPPAIDSFYWFCLNRYRKAGVLWRDDRAFADDYGVSKNTVGSWVKFLERNGWLIPRRGNQERLVRNKQTGMYESIPYDVVEHDAWAASHSGECRYINGPVPKTGTGRTDKSAKKKDSSRTNGRRASAGVQSLKLGQVQSLSSVTTSPYFRDVCSKDCSLQEVEKPTHDAEGSLSLASARGGFSSTNQMDENHHHPKTRSDPADALLTAARVFTLEYGETGIDLAAYIAAHALNGTGRWPETTTYYSTAAEGFPPGGDDPLFKTDGQTDHMIHPEMLDNALERLQTAALKRNYDAEDVLDRLKDLRERVLVADGSELF